MEDLSQEIIKLSKINSASLINMRIHNIWMEVNKASISGKYFLWNSNLDRIWCELIGDVAKKNDKEDFNKLDKKVSDELGKLKTKKGFSQYSKGDKEILSKIYSSLMEKEAYLRSLMNKQGKGTAYEDNLLDYVKG